jgi:hypothetical protein
VGTVVQDRHQAVEFERPVPEHFAARPGDCIEPGFGLLENLVTGDPVRRGRPVADLVHQSNDGTDPILLAEG